MLPAVLGLTAALFARFIMGYKRRVLKRLKLHSTLHDDVLDKMGDGLNDGIGDQISKINHFGGKVANIFSSPKKNAKKVHPLPETNHGLQEKAVGPTSGPEVTEKDDVPMARDPRGEDGEGVVVPVAKEVTELSQEEQSLLGTINGFRYLQWSDVCASAMCIMLIMTHNSITVHVFGMFECEYVGASADSLYVVSDLTMKCWDTTHTFWALTVAVPALVLWVFGTPIMGATLLYVNRVAIKRALVNWHDDGDEGEVRAIRIKFAYLFRAYEKVRSFSVSVCLSMSEYAYACQCMNVYVCVCVGVYAFVCVCVCGFSLRPSAKCTHTCRTIFTGR
jgi:hypothetical protein